MDLRPLSPTSVAALTRFPLVPLSRSLWIFSAATTLSLTGGFIQEVAVGWSVWQATHATTWLAAASAADMLPTLIVSIPAGALVDRSRPATIFRVSQVVSCLQAIVLCALAVSGHLTLTWLFVCAVFLGTCNAFTLPARLAYMTQLTQRASYRRVVVLFSLGGNTALFAGPMIAGAVISAFGVGAAFAANVLAYIPIITVATMLPANVPTHLEPRYHESVLRQIRDGFGHAIHDRAIFLMLLSFAAAAFTARGIIELGPSIAATTLGGGIGTLSLLLSSIASGAVLGGIWMSRRGGWQERATIITTLTGSAIALICYGASGQVATALAGAALLGFMLAVNNISATSTIQLHTAIRYRGRINSLYNMIFKGGPAIGAAVFGWLAHLTNVRLSSAVAAFVLLLLMLWIVKQAGTVPRSESVPVSPPDL